MSVNEPISTEPGSSLTLQTDAGAIIEVDGDSEILLGDACGKKPKPILVIKYGGAKINDRPAPPPQNPDDQPSETPPPPAPDDAPPIVTQTRVVKVIPKGTVYSVRTGKDANSETVVRVYSGSVDVFPGLQDARSEMADIAKDADALMKEFQAGKITQQEYTNRLMAISMAGAKKADKLVLSIVLKAGEKCTVNTRGEAGKVKKFDVRKE